MFIKKAIIFIALLGFVLIPIHSAQAVTTQQGSAGLEGVVTGNPPTQAPTITSPGNGQSFSNLPITVSGLCQKGLLVEVFSNGVMIGAKDCASGSFSIQTSLFSGRNDLVARNYDSLNRAGPDSNTVTVNFNNALPTTGPSLTLTSEFAKKGANPGSLLTWPITLSGGTGPYAISINWGDKTTLQLISQQFTGVINLQHTYAQAGIYDVTIQATDSKGQVAFLQVVGVGNGPVQQTATTANTQVKIIEIIPWIAIAVLFALCFIAFWLGTRHQVQTIRSKIRRGQAPFG